MREEFDAKANLANMSTWSQHSLQQLCFVQHFVRKDEVKKKHLNRFEKKLAKKKDYLSLKEGSISSLVT